MEFLKIEYYVKTKLWKKDRIEKLYMANKINKSQYETLISLIAYNKEENNNG